MGDVLDDLTINDLDQLAATNALDGYPASGRKQDKVDALRAAGVRPVEPGGDVVTIEAMRDTTDLRRGDVVEVELTERVLQRAANGTVKILARSEDGAAIAPQDGPDRGAGDQDDDAQAPSHQGDAESGAQGD